MTAEEILMVHNDNTRRRIRRRARQRAAAQRQRLVAAITVVVISAAIFQVGYLYRQITHPERALVVQVVDTEGNVLDTSEIRYAPQE